MTDSPTVTSLRVIYFDDAWADVHNFLHDHDLDVHHHHGPDKYELVIHQHDQYGALEHHMHSVGTANNRPLSIDFGGERHDHERKGDV